MILVPCECACHSPRGPKSAYPRRPAPRSIFSVGRSALCILFLHHASTPQRACIHSLTCCLQLYTLLNFCYNLLFCTFCRQPSHPKTPALKHACNRCTPSFSSRASSFASCRHYIPPCLGHSFKKTLLAIDCTVVFGPATCSRLLFPPSPSRLALTFPTHRSTAPAHPPQTRSAPDWLAHNRRYNPV